MFRLWGSYVCGLQKNVPKEKAKRSVISLAHRGQKFLLTASPGSIAELKSCSALLWLIAVQSSLAPTCFLSPLSPSSPPLSLLSRRSSVFLFWSPPFIRLLLHMILHFRPDMAVCFCLWPSFHCGLKKDAAIIISNVLPGGGYETPRLFGKDERSLETVDGAHGCRVYLFILNPHKEGGK